MMIEELIKEYGGVECSAMDVYTDIFKLDKDYIQDENEPSGAFKANPLIYFKNKNDIKGHYRILFRDTFKDVLAEGQQADFAITNGITYFGRKNLQKHASKMYAMIFDLDGITESGLTNLLYGCFEPWMTRPTIYPLPNYISMSGNNVHLYYVFEEPIPLYPNIKLQLKNLKYNLISLMWNRYTSSIEKPQYQGINQGFRPIGAKTKIKGRNVRVFKMNEIPYTLEYLNAYVSEENRIDINNVFKETKYSLEEAKEKFPKWYERVVLKKQKAVNKWDIAGKVNGNNPYALYDWWFKQINSDASYGHRYFCIMTLTIYAIKCDVPLEKLKKDAYSLIDKFTAINKKEPFTKEDIDSALECYDYRYCTFPIKDIEKLSAIRIKKNKRNYRKQAQHLKIARFTRDLNYDGDTTAWINRDGRPMGSGTKQEMVQEWRRANPNGKKIDCERALGVSRHTVLKWWDKPVIKIKRDKPDVFSYELKSSIDKKNIFSYSCLQVKDEGK